MQERAEEAKLKSEAIQAAQVAKDKKIAEEAFITSHKLQQAELRLAKMAQLKKEIKNERQ